MQKHPNLELVLVDDGSTDGTLAVLEELKGEDVRIIRQENGGPASTRNRGIEIAGGRWIAFLDADDRWVEGKLEAQLGALESNTDAAFSYTDARNVRGDQILGVQKPAGTPEDLFLNLLIGPQFGTGSVIRSLDLPAAIQRMTDLLFHRGPDDGDERIWQPRAPENPAVAFGHRRLSIIDLSPAGRQPMASADCNSAVVLNGEIYNFKEKRTLLK